MKNLHYGRQEMTTEDRQIHWRTIIDNQAASTGVMTYEVINNKC